MPARHRDADAPERAKSRLAGPRRNGRGAWPRAGWNGMVHLNDIWEGDSLGLMAHRARRNVCREARPSASAGAAEARAGIRTAHRHGGCPTTRAPRRPKRSPLAVAVLVARRSRFAPRNREFSLRQEAPFGLSVERRTPYRGIPDRGPLPRFLCFSARTRHGFRGAALTFGGWHVVF